MPSVPILKFCIITLKYAEIICYITSCMMSVTRQGLQEDEIHVRDVHSISKFTRDGQVFEEEEANGEDYATTCKPCGDDTKQTARYCLPRIIITNKPVVVGLIILCITFFYATYSC